MNRQFTQVATLLTALTFPSFALAQATVQEQFSYSAGTGLNGQNGGIGWAGGWGDPSSTTSVSASSLSYGSLQTAGGSVALSSTPLNFQSATRNAATALPSSGTFWVSFLIQRTANTTTQPFQTDEYGGVSFGGNPFNAGERVFIGAGPVGLLANTNIQYTVGTSGLPRTDVAPTGGTAAVATATTNPTALIVARVDMNFVPVTNEERVQVFVNPSAAALGNNASAPTSPNLTHLIQFNTTSNVLALQYGNGGGYTIDEFRIGNNWADVTPVPEPVSALSVLAFGSVLAVRLRRRLTR